MVDTGKLMVYTAKLMVDTAKPCRGPIWFSLLQPVEVRLPFERTLSTLA